MKPTKTRKQDHARAKAINGKLVDVPSAEKWAAQICSRLSKSVDSILEIGRVLVKAKKDLAHGEWQRLFDERLVPFSQSAGERLMKIATHPLLSQATHASILPPSWYTLYELTKLPEAQLARAIEAGHVTPDMPRDVARSLMQLAAPAHANHGSHGSHGGHGSNGSSSAPRPGGRETLTLLIARLKLHPRTPELDAVLSLCEALRNPTLFLDRFEQALTRYRSTPRPGAASLVYSSSLSATS